MRWQTTAVLAVVLLALGAFYYVYEIRGGPERAKLEAQKGRLWTVDAADVAEVELRRGAEVVTLKRETDGWRLLGPVTARGDRGKVDETLTTLTAARVDREIEPAPTGLTASAPDKPPAVVTLRLKNGRQLGLQLGVKNPTGVWVYAREADKPAVFVVSDTVLRDVTRPLADLRDKTVLAVGQRQVTAFEVVTPEETLAVEQVDGRWRPTRPVALAAEAETVTAFLDKLGPTRIKEFVAESPKSLAPYGLVRPLRVSIHTGRDKDRATASLLIGSVDKAKQGAYAMRPGESSVLLLPAEAWAIVPKNVAVLRNKVVVEVDRDKVARVDLESPKGKVALTQEQNRWRIVAPENLPADQVESGALLFKVRDLKAQGFLTDDASGIPRYLARPTVRVTITETGAAAPTTVLLAPARGRRRDRHRARGPTRGRPRVREAQGVARDLLRRHEGARRAPEDPRRLQELIGRGGEARADPRADAVDRPLDVVLEERLREPPVPVRAVAVPAAGVAEREDLRATHADDLEPRRARGEPRRERLPLGDVVVRVAVVQEDGALRAEALREPHQLPGPAGAHLGRARKLAVARRREREDAAERRIGEGRRGERAPPAAALARENHVLDRHAALGVEVRDGRRDERRVVRRGRVGEVADLGEHDDVRVAVARESQNRGRHGPVRPRVRPREAVVVDQDDRSPRILVPVQRASGEVALDGVGGARRGHQREGREEGERPGRHSSGRGLLTRRGRSPGSGARRVGRSTRVARDAASGCRGRGSC